MLNLFQKYRRAATPGTRELRQQFSEHFFAQEEHAWLTPAARSHFEALFARLPSALLTTLLRQPFSFVPSEAFKQNGAARYQLQNTVVVFPEYQRLLQGRSMTAVAFLAHEMGLMLYELDATSEKDPLMAEVEADKFVCDMGLADELEQLLLAMDECTEKRLRLTYLTIKSLGIN